MCQDGLVCMVKGDDDSDIKSSVPKHATATLSIFTQSTTFLVLLSRVAQVAQTCKPGLEDFSNL